MTPLITQGEIKEIFKEFVEEGGIELENKKKEFKDFLKFLGIDFYDWVRENLRCYFREES